MPVSRRSFLQGAVVLSAEALLGQGSDVDLSNAELVLPPNASERVRTYAAMFVEESQKRCRVLWRPGAGTTKIRLSVRGGADEGYEVSSSGSEVRIEGHSERGLLYGIGYLLRNAEYLPQRMLLPQQRAHAASTPAYRLRGHQLGYRPKTNSYDGWDVEDWHQYIRDLAVFGVNAIEILPPRTDDDATSPHFPLPPEQMMVEVSRLADRYGLDVWMWYPAMARDYVSAEAMEAALRDWAAVFEKLPRLDAVFTPGGDPGDTPPAILLELLKRQKENARRYHPQIQMWVSPQSFGARQLEEFYKAVSGADWLDGVVHGPQCRMSAGELRERIRKDLPIRLYPDITHSLQCQLPVPNWKREFAFTEGRECINPRPRGQAGIARQMLPSSIGFISYSEGCNDDVNKCVWSRAAWDRDLRVEDCLAEYGRYFIGSEAAREFAEGLLRLEANWEKPEQCERTLEQFRSLEKKATPAMDRNWRFQQALYRAYYDAYSFARLQGYVNVEWRERVILLGEDLFQSIHMQLDVEHYRAESVSRGANLDTLDAYLFGPKRRLDPGPGGFYDDLGDPEKRPHLVQPKLETPDPEFRRSVLIGFLYPDSLGKTYPMEWKRWGETLFDTPLELHYPRLERGASYRVRVVYSGDVHKMRVRLEANGVEIHPLMEKPWPPRPLEFEVPRTVTAGGSATFSWTRESGLGGSGRGCQISEVWLIRS